MPVTSLARLNLPPHSLAPDMSWTQTTSHNVLQRIHIKDIWIWIWIWIYSVQALYRSDVLIERSKVLSDLV